jgi:3-deoxy-manno-octulosonate cytidylyltransferase (CMP-KDO synthetase)
MKIIAVVPARLGSTRLPRKPLREILGKPMVQRVYEAAKAATGLDEVMVATDSYEIMSLGQELGMNVVMTSSDCKSGTDRVREVAVRFPADVYINVQGDEPLARPEHINALVEMMRRGEQIRVATLKTTCPAADVSNPNAVKVVCDSHGRALYFSRSAIPFDRDAKGGIHYYKHLGFYAYHRPTLEAFPNLHPSALEDAEKLEQLRFLENGIPIYVAETPFDTVGVDTEEDVKRVEEILRREGRA